ncbi:MAG: hypothetical protein RR449_01495 [Christensenella sp.]
MDGMVTAFGTSLATVQSDAMSMMGTALPIALVIIGAFIAVRLGIKFFKNVSR